ncbi:MAG TPA: heme-binding beta-barrel domain-containing protein [bacterium]|nr:heme-binding beta-barrel domain-containing protein [bacterium]
MAQLDLEQLGPLQNLVGPFEGGVGDDIAPSDDRGTENNKYREIIVFTHILPTANHEQTLYGLRYHQQVFRHGEEFPFHDQVGYWHWDPKAKLVMQSLTIPRGQAVLAGGPAAQDAKSLKLKAQLGSPTFGIASNPFLDKEFKTVEYEIQITFLDGETFSYEQMTKIQIKGHPKIFEHRDKNTLKRLRD